MQSYASSVAVQGEPVTKSCDLWDEGYNVHALGLLWGDEHYYGSSDNCAMGKFWRNMFWMVALKC